MTAEQNTAGASFHGVTDWHDIDWKSVSHTVRRLQARIVQATKEKRWGKVKALQRLLTHSFSGKALAVRRVTENQGKNTPGVDKITWNTPQKKLNAIYSLRQRDYRPQPLRRIYIPKKTGKKRPLGIPIWAAHYLSFQAMFGIPCVLLLGDRELRSPVIVLLYHKLRCMTSAPLLPLPSDWLAQCGDDLRSERNPAWSQRRGKNTFQDTSLAPVRNGRDIDIEQLGGSACRVAPVSPLSGGCSLRTLRASSRDVIGIANPLDFADRKRASHASLLSFLIEQGGNLGICLRRRQLPHAVHHLWTGLTFFPGLLVTWDGQMRERLGLPTNSHIDDITALSERHILDQPAQQLLALNERGRWRMPERRQVMSELANLLALHGSQQKRRRFGQQSMLSLQLFYLSQLLIPLPLQAPRHEAVVRVDRFVATTGQVRFVLRPLNLTLPLVIDLLGVGFHPVQGREGHFQVGGLDGLQKARNYGLINTISPHGLTSSSSELRMKLVTFVHQQGAIALIPNAHASATRATQDDPLQERRSLSNRSSMLLSAPGAIVIELPLIAQEVFPGDVARMRIQEHDRPVLLFDTAGLALYPGVFPSQHLASGLGTPIDVGPRVQGAVQDVQHTLMCETTPDQFICSLASPPPRREAQVLLGKGTDHGKCRVKLLKERKNQANGFLHGLIWVKHNPANGIVGQPDRQAKTQAPLFGFAQLPSLQATLQPMELSLRHASLEAKQQAVVMGSWVIHPLIINDERIGERTDFQQPIPIAARASQSRDLQTEHRPNVPQTDLGHQPLKAIATNRRRARLSLVLVHHLDTGRCPSQILSALDEIILPGRTTSVFSHLEN